MGMSNSQYGKGGQMPPGYSYGTLVSPGSTMMANYAGPAGLRDNNQASAQQGGSWRPGFYGQNSDYFGQPMTAGKGGGGGKASGTPAPYTGQGMFNLPGGGSQYPWPQPGGMWWQGNQGQGVYQPPPAPGAPPAGTTTPTPAPPVWQPPPPGGAVGGSAGQGGATKMPTITPGHAWAPEGFNMDNPADWERIQKPGATTTTADGKIIWTPVPGNAPGAATTTTPPPGSSTMPFGHTTPTPTPTTTTTPGSSTMPFGHTTTPGTVPTPISPVDQAKANGITDPKVLELIASGYLGPDGKINPSGALG